MANGLDADLLRLHPDPAMDIKWERHAWNDKQWNERKRRNADHSVNRNLNPHFRRPSDSENQEGGTVSARWTFWERRGRNAHSHRNHKHD